MLSLDSLASYIVSIINCTRNRQWEHPEKWESPEPDGPFMLSVSIANQQEALELDYARIKTVARGVLQGEGLTDAKVTLAFMTDPAIHALNKRFLEHDEPTDVISFPYSSKPLHGDLAISTETAISAAAERGHPPAEELLLYVIHGILHLCGYDDTSDKKRKVMRQKETHYLTQLGVVLKN